jgi:hypothetical protein
MRGRNVLYFGTLAFTLQNVRYEKLNCELVSEISITYSGKKEPG